MAAKSQMNYRKSSRELLNLEDQGSQTPRLESCKVAVVGTQDPNT
jgi:hypothetical protein